MSAKKSTVARPDQSTTPAAAPRSTKAADPNAPSEETQVVQPATEEPVRHGGWILTDNGWVPEED